MKSIARTLVYIWVCLCLLFVLCACGSKSLDDGVFLYTVMRYGDKEQITIYGLTKEGEEREYLLVPEEINGIPVTRIDGYAENKVLKKLFIPKSVASVNNRLNSIMSERNSFITGNAGYKCIFFHKTYGPYLVSGGADCYYAENAKYETTSLLATHVPKIGDVQYYRNADDPEDIYFVDDLEAGETFGFLPSDPTREGYDFCGWYTEKEGGEPFSFDGYVKSDKSILRLYARWEKR